MRRLSNTILRTLQVSIVIVAYISFVQAQSSNSTPSPTPASGSFPSTDVLDDFNRADGSLGDNWSGATSGYNIAGKRAAVTSGDVIYWNAATFGADQEVFVTLGNIDPDGQEIDLLLKVQDGGWPNGTIEIWFHPAEAIIQVVTYTKAQDWVQRGDNIPVTFAAGDQFGARAKADGGVEVYQNGTLLATRDVSEWPFYADGGSVGLWMINTSKTILDDFGGGDVTESVSTDVTPVVTPAADLTTTAAPTIEAPNVLDDFNRADGPIGKKWTIAQAKGYRIANQQLIINTGGPLYWSGTIFGADQQVFVTLAAIDPGSEEIDLLLKTQHSDWNNGVIEVLYNPGAGKVQVMTYASGQNWVQRGDDIPVTFADGDQFGARAKADGTVEVYQNRSLLAIRDVSEWPYYANRGKIGLWMVNAGATLLDDFSGGNVS